MTPIPIGPPERVLPLLGNDPRTPEKQSFLFGDPFRDPRRTTESRTSTPTLGFTNWTRGTFGTVNP